MNSTRSAAALVLSGLFVIVPGRQISAATAPAPTPTIAPQPLLSPASAAQARRGDALAREGRLAEAEAAYREADRLQPDEVPVLERLSGVQARLEKTAEALATLERAIRRGRHFEDKVYLLAARLFSRRSEQVLGEKKLIAWAGDRPITPNFHAAIGILRMGTFDYVSAEPSLRKALETDPGNEAALAAMFQLYGRFERLDRLQPILEKGVKAAPHSVAVQMLMGNCLLRQEKFEGARDVFAKLVRLEPTNASARVNLGSALHGLGDTEGGIAQFREAIAVDPRSIEAPVNLALALEQAAGTGPPEARARKLGEARDILQAARSRGLDSVDLLNALAMAHHLNGDLGAAIATAEESLARDSGQPVVVRMLEKFRQEKASRGAAAPSPAAGIR